MKQSFSIKSKAFWIGNLLIAGPIFVAFHIAVRAINLVNMVVVDQVALMLVFVFFIMNPILAALTQEKESAVYLHQLNNILVMLRKLWGVFG